MLSTLNTLPICLLGLMGARPWPTGEGASTLAERIKPPEGYTRVKAEPKSFSAWLRALPVKPGRPQVKLYNGRLKGVQDAHVAVLDIDVGKKDLQQCADAVMRLRAEYLWSTNKRDKICFRFTSGDKVPWSGWRSGVRPKIRGNKVRFKKTAKKDGSYKNFRRYMEQIFYYAGTSSLSRELRPVDLSKDRVAPGDVFIKGGFPGHAVIVVDVAENKDGKQIFLLAQSYMPAQEIHILKNPKYGGPWYTVPKGKLETPEWTFEPGALTRFSDQGCPPMRPRW